MVHDSCLLKILKMTVLPLLKMTIFSLLSTLVSTKTVLSSEGHSPQCQGLPCLRGCCTLAEGGPQVVAEWQLAWRAVEVILGVTI